MVDSARPSSPLSRRLFGAYASLVRREPQARAYLGAALVDDIGIAVSAWASALMMTNLATTQRARASLMLPTLLCFLVGTLVSGPLADWVTRNASATLADLAKWRWKIVVAGRALETLLLGYLVFQLSTGEPTVGRVLPYVMVAAFMKTGLRATRIAFSVDLLEEESEAVGANGEVLRDERGEPLRYKKHLVTFSSLTSFLSTIAVLVGLLAGREVMALAGNRFWLLFAVDIVTNLGFLAVVFFACKPRITAASDEPIRVSDPSSGIAKPRGRFRHFWGSFADGFRFLAAKERRPLLALLAGSWLVEVITEAFDGKMVIKHVLHAGDDGLRHAEIVWTVVAAIGAALLPLLVRRLASIGKIFLVTMFVDGMVIAAAGAIAGAAAPAVLLPFTAAIALDKSLTLTSTTLTEIAQNSISSAAMRGRIAGTFALCVIVGDMLSEGLASMAEQRWGIPGLVVRAGLLQVGLVGLLALGGGRKLWSFGLRSEGSESRDGVESRATTPASPAALREVA